MTSVMAAMLAEEEECELVIAENSDEETSEEEEEEEEEDDDGMNMEEAFDEEEEEEEEDDDSDDSSDGEVNGSNQPSWQRWLPSASTMQQKEEAAVARLASYKTGGHAGTEDAYVDTQGAKQQKGSVFATFAGCTDEMRRRAHEAPPNGRSYSPFPSSSSPFNHTNTNPFAPTPTIQTGESSSQASSASIPASASTSNTPVLPSFAHYFSRPSPRPSVVAPSNHSSPAFVSAPSVLIHGREQHPHHHHYPPPHFQQEHTHSSGAGDDSPSNGDREDLLLNSILSELRQLKASNQELKKTSSKMVGEMSKCKDHILRSHQHQRQHQPSSFPNHRPSQPSGQDHDRRKHFGFQSCPGPSSRHRSTTVGASTFSSTSSPFAVPAVIDKDHQSGDCPQSPGQVHRSHSVPNLHTVLDISSSLSSSSSSSKTSSSSSPSSSSTTSPYSSFSSSPLRRFPPCGGGSDGSDRNDGVVLDTGCGSAPFVLKDSALPTALLRREGNGAVFAVVNDAFCKLYGWKQEELVDKCWSILIPESEREKCKQAFATLFQRSSSIISPIFRMASKHKAKGGQVYDVVTSHQTFYSQQGLPCSHVVSVEEYRPAFAHWTNTV